MKFSQVPILTTVIIFTICPGATNSMLSSIGPTQFVSGAVPLKEPDTHHPIMYSSVMPVIYKFLLPKWDLHTMKIQFWKSHNNCTESDTYGDGYPCPIMHHLNYLIEYFTNNMTSWNNLPSEEFTKPPLASSNDFLENPSILWDKTICSKLLVEPHFKRLRTSSRHLEKYIQVLSQCANALNIKIENLTDTAAYLENEYHNTFTSFTSDYWSLISTPTIREGMALVAWTTLEAGLMSHQFMETQKLAQAVEICKNYQIPWTLIKSESLKELLKTMKSTLLEDEQDFAIPEENLSKYFKLPLSDCIFGEDNTFIVRILVPLIPKEAASRNHFVRFHPVSFATQGKLCSILNGKESIPFNMGLNGILPCTCAKSDTFCKGWNSHEECPSSTQESCIQALTSDNQHDVMENCPLQCRNVPATYQHRQQLEIMIQKNATSKVKIIPAPFTLRENEPFYVECSGKKMRLSLEPEGAYQVSLPVNCKIEVGGGYSTVSGNLTDIGGVHVDHLMPFEWLHGISIHENVGWKDDSLEGVDPKVVSKLHQLDKYCNRTLGDTLIWLMVLLLLVANICLIVVVLQLYKWKNGQMQKNSSRLIYNVAPINEDLFPISDNTM